VKYIIPHPRNVKLDLYGKLELQVLGGAMIAEDVILSEVARGVSVKVIGVYSSVIFNIAGVDGVEIVNVRAAIAKPVEHLESLLRSLGVSLDEDFI